MQPTVIRLLEAFAACALEDEHLYLSERVEALHHTIDHVHRQVDHVSRQLDHVQQDGHRLLRLMKQLLEQTVTDPAQIQALSDLLKESEARLTEAVSEAGGTTPPPTQ